MKQTIAINLMRAITSVAKLFGMRPTVLAMLFLVLAIIPATADDLKFPLLGLWRLTSGVYTNGESVATNEQMEFEFRPANRLVVTAVSPSMGILTPIRMYGRYTFQPPDVLTYSLTSAPIERQRFSLVGDILTFRNLDFKITSTLQRIQKTGFKEKPKDIQGTPK